MSEVEQKISNIKNEIGMLTQQTQNKITDLQFEIIKLQHPELNEYVNNNFNKSCVHFDDKLFGRKEKLLERCFGVKFFDIPVEVKYVDNKNVLITGIKENLNAEHTDLYDELNKLTKLTNNYFFPLKAKVINSYCQLGEEFNYGEVEDNILGIQSVFLMDKYKKENTIRIYHKSDKYKHISLYYIN